MLQESLRKCSRANPSMAFLLLLSIVYLDLSLLLTGAGGVLVPGMVSSLTCS